LDLPSHWLGVFSLHFSQAELEFTFLYWNKAFLDLNLLLFFLSPAGGSSLLRRRNMLTFTDIVFLSLFSDVESEIVIVTTQKSLNTNAKVKTQIQKLQHNTRATTEVTQQQK